MAEKKRSARDRELMRGKLTAQLADRQRELGENSDKAARCEGIIRECRETLALGRDHQHFGWLVPVVLLAIGGAFFSSISARVLAGICFFAAVVLGIRWLASLCHCLTKYNRVYKRMQHNIKECDRLADKNSALRLETLELRQKLEQLEIEERSNS